MIDAFMPHGMCFAWDPRVLALHVLSDALIALAYFSIPALLVRFALRRSDLPFKPVFWMFGVFIVACGATHVLAIWVIWHPTYWLEGAVKALTAAASIATAVALVPLIPKALALRSPRELEAVNVALAEVNRTLEDALVDLAREQRVAHRFQTAAMVKALPAVAGFVLSGYYDSAATDLGVGGDWYDAFTLADGRIVLTAGDVAGNGLDAAIQMAKVRQSLRAAAAIHIEPGAILDAADRTLRVEYPDTIVTAFVGIVDRIEESFTYANAGHPWPYLRRANGTIDELRSVALPLGLRDVGTPETRSTPFRRNDVLVIFTDGLVEATHDLLAGEARLHAAVAALDANDPDAARTLALRTLTVDATDDVAVIVLSCTHDAPASHLLRRSVASNDGAAAGIVRAEIVDALRLRGASESDLLTAELIYSELLGNVYRYATGLAEIVLDLGGTQPVLHVLDTGEGFQHAARLPNDLLSERGRGLFLVASLSDDFHIMRRPGGGSHARVVLRVPVAARKTAIA